MEHISPDPRRIEELVGGLADQGYAIAHSFVPIRLVADLAAEAEHREGNRELADAGIGRGDNQVIADRVRRASGRWLDGGSDSERLLLAIAESLRLAINRRLFLGLFEFEAQLLSYPPGGFYARHLDSLAGARNRVVSLVLYLNEGWQAADGGELVLWPPGGDGPPAACVVPKAGTLVLMLSEEIPHEVRPARRQRRAIAGWFRVNASTSHRADPLG